MAASVLVLGGCADPPAEVPAPVVSEAPVRTSGALFDGFEIEPGSGLVGTVFPVITEGGDGRQAVLRVDGDGQRVFDGYVQQAEALEFAVKDDHCCRPDEQLCSDPDDDLDDEPPEPFVVGCDVHGSGPDDVTISLRAFLGADGEGHVLLRTQVYTGATASLPLLPDGPAAPATEVEVAPDLTPETDDPPVRVVEGSAPVTEPIPAECVSGGYVVVLQVSGELLPVLRGYQEQFADAGFGSDGLVGSEDEPRVDGYTAGGGILTAVGVPGDPSHVLIERCND